MVPVRLALRNFLSYGEEVEPIDFTGLHVACLSGNNGHGKSALLDAMTWALWGQARSNSADDLVRLHQTEMRVEFEFDLEGSRYQVVRKRTRGKTGQSDLQFRQFDAQGNPKPLTEGGVRGTQERIQQVLRMDYETFINSAFILQNRADEFARKPPGERKRILGEILNLQAYDELSERASARARDASAQKTALEGEIARLSEEAAREPARRAEVARLEREEQDARLAGASARAELNEALVRKAEVDARRRERDDLARRLAGAVEEIRRLEQSRAGAERRIGAAQALLERAPEIRGRHQELLQVRARVVELQKAMLAARELETRRTRLERELDRRAQELKVKLEVARQSLAQLRAFERQRPEVAGRLEQWTRQVAVLDQLVQEQQEIQVRLEALAGERAAASAERARLQEEERVCSERFLMLKQAEAICPVCEEPLSKEQRRELGFKVRAEKEDLAKRIAASGVREAEAAAATQRSRQRSLEVQRKLEHGESWRKQLAQAEQELAKLDVAIAEMPEASAVIRGLEEALARGDFAPEIRAELRGLEEEIARLAYDEEEHRSLHTASARLEGCERELLLLEQAERDAPAAEAERAEAEALLAEKQRNIAADQAALEGVERALDGAPEVDAFVERLQGTMLEAEATCAQLARELGSAQSALTACREQARLLGEKRAARDETARDQANYEQLARLFGRNGIQAKLIENAIPEIEEEANAILARMSENEMRVTFHTQREKKTSGIAETLEIQISDSLGSRRYELFSGGEAFRVNFAIRIALSKLLARRAGARLQTLIIDEGFGSQDAEGRERLVEAIQSVQDEFALILVITHVDEMKESFPNRIEVTKTAAGSQLQVV